MVRQRDYPACQARCSPPECLVSGEGESCRYPQYVRLEAARVDFAVEAPEEGCYLLEIIYRSGNRDLCQRMELGGALYKIGFPPSHGLWRTMRYERFLRRGMNTVSLISLGSAVDEESAPVDIEGLFLVCYSTPVPAPVFTLPVLTPQSNAHYRCCAQHLCYNLRDARSIRRVLWRGRELPWRVDTEVSRDGELHFNDSVGLILPQEGIAALPDGTDELQVEFEDGTACASRLTVAAVPPASAMTITVIDVDHGASVLFHLPDGGWLLVDSGYEEMARSRVLPFLRACGIARLDYYLITHYDTDHCGGMEEIRREFSPVRFWDNRSFRPYQELEMGGTSVIILNCDGCGDEANTNSVSFRMEYRGFVYAHGGDIYAPNQRRILRERPELVPAQVYHGNHHLFGTLDPSYLRRCNPVLFLAQANPHCYSKGDHLVHFLRETEDYLKTHQGRLRETLRTFETGNVTLRIGGDGRFTWEAYHGDGADRAL